MLFISCRRLNAWIIPPFPALTSPSWPHPPWNMPEEVIQQEQLIGAEKGARGAQIRMPFFWILSFAPYHIRRVWFFVSFVKRDDGFLFFSSFSP